jgi:hypothetical protein
MKTMAAIMLLGVPILNVVLNSSLQRAATGSKTIGGAIGSVDFGIATIAGLASMLGLLLLYSTGINLARGILLMGAVFIVGGSLYGVFVRKHSLSYAEYAMLFLISALLLYRAFGR